MSWSHARRALKPKALPSKTRPTRRLRPSLSVNADTPFAPGPLLPMHLSLHDKWKRRKELLLRTAPRAGRHHTKKLYIVINGAQVQDRHSNHSRLCGSCRISVRPSDCIDCNQQRTFGIWQCRHPFIDPVCVVWVERAPGRVWQEEIRDKINKLISCKLKKKN